MKIDVLGTQYTIEFRERNTDKLLNAFKEARAI